MSSAKGSAAKAVVAKRAPESTDPTLDDDNKSDSDDEYEYEEVIEEYEEEVEDFETPVTISEVETIIESEKKAVPETHLLKSDGTTAKMRPKRAKEPSAVRQLTSQEESILMPLIQGLLTANGCDSPLLMQTKHENSPFGDADTAPAAANGAKDGKAARVESENNKSDLPHGFDILGELTAALNRLQHTILEEKDVVVDAQKRNTILTLVAWLKRILQSNDAANGDSQPFALTDLLPAELLLSKLMPQLNASGSNGIGSNGNLSKGSAHDASATNDASVDRSPASSKRFSRQRNHRFNTIGVSKEELADARLYLQKKLLTENLTPTVGEPVAAAGQPQNIFGDDDNRRKSLNLSAVNDLDSDIAKIFNDTINSLNESIDGSATAKQKALANERKAAEPAATAAHSNGILRRKMYEQKGHRHTEDPNPTTDTDDDILNGTAEPINGSAIASPPKAMNKFALRKLKMKRANTIDIPKNDQYDGNDSDHDPTNGTHTTHAGPASPKRNPAGVGQLKSANDHKYLAFMSKHNDHHALSWVNPNKSVTPTDKTNWSSKFGNIKNTFEHQEPAKPQHSSPVLNKRNGFTHAPTSPFKPVQNYRPPPNGSYPYNSQHYQVSQKVAAIQSGEQAPMPEPKAQLRGQKSLPVYAESRNGFHHSPQSQFKAGAWGQPQKHASSVDSYVYSIEQSQVSQLNPLYVAPHRSLSTNQEQKLPLPPPPPQNQRRYSNERQVGAYEQPAARPSRIKASLSPLASDFPNYTYTSTDFTQPTSVSTFGPEPKPATPATPATPAKATILPDTSYLKASPQRTSNPPSLGSARLSNQMRTIDWHSSSECLSEPSSYYRSPKPFSPSYEQTPYADSYSRDSGEFTATSQIMKYPQSQTATYVNKPITKRYDADASTLAPPYARKEAEQPNGPVSPFSESNFSHVNQIYVPPEPISAQTARSKAANNFASMDNLAGGSYRTDGEPSGPIRLRNNTSYYGSQAVLPTQRSSYPIPDAPKPAEMQRPFGARPFDAVKSPKSAGGPLKLNSSGGQYVQPKVEPEDYSDAGPKFSRKKPVQSAAVPATPYRNHVGQIGRNQTHPAQRISEVEIRRKQSLPAQNSDYFDQVYAANGVNEAVPSNQYLPSGVLKRSKSSHTLALLQQFEGKQREEELERSAAPASFVKRPESLPANEVKAKASVAPAALKPSSFVPPVSPMPLNSEPLSAARPLSAAQLPASAPAMAQKSPSSAPSPAQMPSATAPSPAISSSATLPAAATKAPAMLPSPASTITASILKASSESHQSSLQSTALVKTVESRQRVEKTVESRQRVEKTASADTTAAEEDERKTVAQLVKSKESVLVSEARSKQTTVTKAETSGKATVETRARTLSQSSGDTKMTARTLSELVESKHTKSVTESKSHYPADASPHAILRLRSITDAISKSNESNLLTAPAASTDDPTSPCVEDGHIIFPGQTQQTRNRVQHYAQTLNAMLNRKSIVIEEDEEVEVDDRPAGRMGGVQKSKSGTLLAVPKQYESAIRKSEVEEKERTVAAYFAASKNGQSLQRSSSQHSVLSSASMKSLSRHDDKSSTASPLHLDMDAKAEQNSDGQHHTESTITTSSITTTTTTTATAKSAHHLKILRKQQQKHGGSPLAKSQTLPSINLLDETNVDDAFEEIFAAFGK